uniref:Uncharacterized protein n=1 Tax=Arundo donax TaxID=35708 RepID=A0A0A9GBC8_ARUDO
MDKLCTLGKWIECCRRFCDWMPRICYSVGNLTWFFNLNTRIS